VAVDVAGATTGTNKTKQNKNTKFVEMIFRLFVWWLVSNEFLITSFAGFLHSTSTWG
jgi:F0F1-type ATP synthase membrane subunit a